MANILDELFSWAAQQPAGNITQVQIAMTSAETTRGNLVSYAEGALIYRPGHHIGMIYVLPQFESDTD